jgi:DNA-binding NarL/FixJ family response regulator
MQMHLLRSALRRRPDFECFSCAMDESEILQTLKNEKIAVALLSFGTYRSDESMLSIIRRTHLTFPRMPIVVLHEHRSDSVLMDALRVGARGLFSFGKLPFRMLCRCIQRVHDGEAWLSHNEVRHLLGAVAQSPPLRVVNAKGSDLLSPREEQVVALVAEGLSNREIANELQLSEHTVKKYMFRIFDKLGISTRVELVLYAVSHGHTVGAERVPAPLFNSSAT